MDFSDEALQIIRTALEYVAQNYPLICEADVARHCNLSYSYFSRLFKKVMNQTFSAYLTSYRLTKAEHLLLSDDKTVSEISEELGFSTPSYFIQQFKKKNGTSPKQFRLAMLRR